MEICCRCESRIHSDDIGYKTWTGLSVCVWCDQDEQSEAECPEPEEEL